MTGSEVSKSCSSWTHLQNELQNWDHKMVGLDIHEAIQND